MYRVEDKYYCSERDMLLLEKKLSAILKPDDNQFCTGGYCVTSVYFDDINDNCLYDSCEGHRLREKYRIRIYNRSLAVVKLEVKYKRDNRVFKRSEQISINQMKTLLRGEKLKDEMPSMESPVTLFNLAIAGRGLRPKVIVEYDRTAFVFEPGNVRITLDRNIRVGSDIESFGNGEEFFCDPLREEDRVLEIKYDEFLPGFIGRILESGNMNQISYSKYRLCREKKGDIKECL